MSVCVCVQMLCAHQGDARDGWQRAFDMASMITQRVGGERQQRRRW